MMFYGNSRIGMEAQSKTEDVPFDWTTRGEAAINKALKPFEVDGWKARRSDMTNHHYTTDMGQQVVFFRHVNPETKEPIL